MRQSDCGGGLVCQAHQCQAPLDTNAEVRSDEPTGAPQDSAGDGSTSTAITGLLGGG